MVIALSTLSTDRPCQQAEAQKMHLLCDYRPLYYKSCNSLIKVTSSAQPMLCNMTSLTAAIAKTRRGSCGNIICSITCLECPETAWTWMVGMQTALQALKACAWAMMQQRGLPVVAQGPCLKVLHPHFWWTWYPSACWSAPSCLPYATACWADWTPW